MGKAGQTGRALKAPRDRSAGWAWRPGLAFGLAQAPSYCMLLLPPLRGAQADGAAGCLGAALAFFAGLACALLLNEAAWRRDWDRVRALYGEGRALPALGCAGWLLVALAAAAQAVGAGQADAWAQAAAAAGALAAGFAHAQVTLSFHRRCALLTREAAGRVTARAALCSTGAVLVAALLPAPLDALACAACAAAGALLSPGALRGAPEGVTCDALDRRAVLGDPLMKCCAQATVVMAFSSALALVVLWVAAGAGTAPAGRAPAVVALAVGLAAATLAVLRLTRGKLSTISLTYVFRLSLTPLFAAAALALVLAGGQTWAQAWAVPLCAFGLVVMDQGHRIMSVGFLRAGIFHEGVLVTLARCGQVGGALAATAAAWLLPSDALATAGLLLTCATGAAFVLCVPSYEARLAGGEDSLPPAVPEGLANVEHYAPAALQFGLTSRELEVFALLAEGLGAAQIAARLFVSRATVNTHVQHIYAKAGVHSRAELLARAWVASPTQDGARG